MPPKKYTNDELYALSQKLGERLDDLLSLFHLDLARKSKLWVGRCPIHESSNNDSAFNLYHTGFCNWYCRTHGCEKVFKNTPIGLVRGLLSHQNGWQSLKDKDKIVSFADTLAFIEKFLGGDVIKVDPTESEKRKFVSTFKLHERNGHTKLSRAYIRSKLKIPSEYFLGRGFTKEILNKYDIGVCHDSSKPFFNRTVVPVYDDNYDCIVGYTARSILDKCGKCGLYHLCTVDCPQEDDKWKFTKWTNSGNFHRNDYLYNFWFAKDKIKTEGVVTLVEGAADVWRLEEAGFNNSAALFGTALTDTQKFILDCSGATTLILFLDNDPPGIEGAKEIQKRCSKLYNVHLISYEKIGFLNYNDVGEIPQNELREKFGAFLKTI